MSRRKDFIGNILAMVESSGGEFNYLGNCIAISDLGNRKTNIHQIVDKNDNF